MVQGCCEYSLVPCDLCDHSQISHVVSNDVRKLFTTVHVITDWPIRVPLAATDVNHRNADGNFPLRAPGDRQGTVKGERSVCKQHRSLPCQH
ncbi:unnamed protein product, partial [Staurois parvus]